MSRLFVDAGDIMRLQNDEKWEHPGNLVTMEKISHEYYEGER